MTINMSPNIQGIEISLKPLFQADLKQLANRLCSMDVTDFRNHVIVTPAECLTVCQLTTDMLKNRHVCLSLQSPMTIVGDIHGQFHDLLRLFDSLGNPPETRYLFLGDYVDRGKYSIEVIVLLFTFMLIYPTSVFLIRGNHETANICSRYGFKAEIHQRYPKMQASKVLGGFLRAFQWLPLCAIVDGRFFCAHGGISPSLLLPPFNADAGRAANLQVLATEMRRPLEPKKSGISIDLLWSDPIPALPAVYVGTDDEMQEAKWAPSSRRQCSFLFSAPALQQVLRVFRTHLLVRGHQIAHRGFTVNHDKHCITLFSAPGYCGVQTNFGAVLQIVPTRRHGEAKEAGTFFVLKPIKRDPQDIENLFWTDLGDSFY